jgi:hypothetical protein
MIKEPQTMQVTALVSVILLTTIGLVSNSSGLPQTASSSQIKQAFGVQKWSRTIQAVNQINRAANTNPNSELTLYQSLLSHK